MRDKVRGALGRADVDHVEAGIETLSLGIGEGGNFRLSVDLGERVLKVELGSVFFDVLHERRHVSRYTK